MISVAILDEMHDQLARLQEQLSQKQTAEAYVERKHDELALTLVPSDVYESLLKTLEVLGRALPNESQESLAQTIKKARAAGLPQSAATRNPFLATAGMFANDPLADEVDAAIAAARQHERDEAAREAMEAGE